MKVRKDPCTKLLNTPLAKTKLIYPKKKNCNNDNVLVLVRLQSMDDQWS